jgi:SUMO ligase MMS21 Smc5/6 complex component
MKIKTNLLTPNDQAVLLVLAYGKYPQAATKDEDIKELAVSLVNKLGSDYCNNLFLETAKRMNVNMPEVVTGDLMELGTCL